MKKRFAERLEALRSVEHGFTLLELLVAMMILSILVATASQLYFQHRRKAWTAQVRASLRHMAGAENYFVFVEGSPAFTADLDDLHLAGYRWNDGSVRPYVALATNQTFCIQVSSAHDASIVWHFSSDVGRPEPGPATSQDCGDPTVLGTYIAGLPPESAGRDGRLSTFAGGSSTASIFDTSASSTDTDSSTEEGDFGSDGWGTGGGSDRANGTETEVSTVESSTPGYGTSSTTSGTVPPDGTGSTARCTGGHKGSGSTSGTNHPSGSNRDTENGDSGEQGGSDSDPDGDENDGADKPGEEGGANTGDQDGNNGSGNDTDFEDDNRGPDYDGTPYPGGSC